MEKGRRETPHPVPLSREERGVGRQVDGLPRELWLLAVLSTLTA